MDKNGETAWDGISDFSHHEESSKLEVSAGSLRANVDPLSSKTERKCRQRLKEQSEAASQQVFSAVQVINLNQRSQFQCHKEYAVSL